MSRRCAKCCCFVCHPGRSRREGEHTGVVGSSTGRGPAQAMYAHTAGCEGVTRDERVTGMPCEPSRPGLFVPVAVDGSACDIYPQWAGTRPPDRERSSACIVSRNADVCCTSCQATTKIKNAVLVVLSCTNIVLSGSDISVTRDATTYGRSLRAALQCSSCVARQNKLKRCASPSPRRAPRVPRGRPHRGRRAHIDTHVDLLPTPSYGATPARAGRQRGDFRRDAVLAV